MRDVKRIKPLLSKIEVLWRECPYFKFGIVIEMIKNEVGQEDILLVEENLLEDAIDRLLDKNKWNNSYFMKEVNRRKAENLVYKDKRPTCEEAGERFKRFSGKGTFKVMTKEELVFLKLLDEVRMLHGLKPHDKLNPCYKDGYFAKSIEENYSKEDIKRALTELELR